MTSILKVDTIQDQSGNNIINENADTITIGASGDTITIPSGATLSSTDPLVFPAGTVSAPAITTTGDTNTGIFFPAADEIAFTEGGTEAMRITSDGAMLLGTTTAGSASAGDLVVNGGVFLGGSAAANELNDYEEGTWTPDFGNIVAPTYESRSGRYTKIGRIVYCTAEYNVTSLDNTDGSAYAITGLPFTGNFDEEACVFTLGRFCNLLGTQANQILINNIRFSGTSLIFMKNNDDGLSYSSGASSGTLQFAFTYAT